MVITTITIEEVIRLKRFLLEFGNNDFFTYFQKRDVFTALNNNRLTILASIAKKDIGYAHVDFDGIHHWFGLAVLDEFRGCGVGSALLKFAIDDAKSCGYDLRLSVAKDNTKAFALYSRSGFRTLKITDKNVFMELLT
jgi:ribosomal protein S18 acetylase RimI-like enzyme